MVERGRLATFLFNHQRYAESKKIREGQLRRYIDLGDDQGRVIVEEELREIEGAIKS